MGVDVMTQRAFRSLYWGFLFIMIDFRLQGIDVLPDIIGYAFFAAAFGSLTAKSDHFAKATNYNIIMIIVSIFSIYERPAQGGGINIQPFGFIIGIVALIFGLLVVYNLFMGIKDMSGQSGRAALPMEAEQRWKQFLILQLAGYGAILLLIVPPLALIYIIGLLIASIVLTFAFMGFMTRCGEELKDICV